MSGLSNRQREYYTGFHKREKKNPRQIWSCKIKRKRTKKKKIKSYCRINNCPNLRRNGKQIFMPPFFYYFLK